MRNLMMKLCDFLEKKLYDEPTFRELSNSLDRTRYRLEEAVFEISNLKTIIMKLNQKR